MKNKDVVILCGEYPENHIAPNIGNDPTYVFVNDPGFEQVRLFDQDGNTVLVNSFIECEHYVTGGWGFSPLKNQELLLQDLMLYFIIFGVIVSFLKPKIKEFFQN